MSQDSTLAAEHPSRQRRITDRECFDPSFVMGLLYTVIYAGMVCSLILIDVPEKNTQAVNILIGVMTGIQTSIVAFFFGATKAGREQSQLVAQSKERTDSTMREIVSSAVAPLPVDLGRIKPAVPAGTTTVDITAKNASITKSVKRGGRK